MVTIQKMRLDLIDLYEAIISIRDVKQAST